MLPKDWDSVNRFPQDLFDQIKVTLEKAMKETPKPWVAAFDADGTLWDTDLGEAFFQYQIKHCKLQLPEDPWQHYQNLKEPEYTTACIWLAQINKGRSLEQVRKWSHNCLETISPVPVFEFQKRLIAYLNSVGIKVYIVTASIKWAIEPAARLFGLGPDSVIGMETTIRNGVITEDGIKPYSYAAGKVTALLAKTRNVRPILTAGNTMGDLPLLESATHVAIACSAAPKGHEIFETEMKLQEIAKQKNWFNLRLR